MIHFDEKSFAEKMHDTQKFINSYGVTELTIYAKWIRYNKIKELEKDYNELTDDEIKKIDNEVERILIEFSEKNYLGFNYVINYIDIDRALENSRNYKLRLPAPIPITQKEWDAILSVEHDNYRRVLFVMLVDAKYYRYNGTGICREYVVDENTVFYTQMTDNEILKASKAKFANKSEKRHVWNYLYKLNLADITNGRLKARYVNIVDINSTSKVIDYITDYDHLDLHYERLLGVPIAKCKFCGALYKQNRQNNTLYCYKHRGYQKKELRFGVCVDCGREFSVASNNHKKIRCDNCQVIYRKEYKARKYAEKTNQKQGSSEK